MAAAVRKLAEKHYGPTPGCWVQPRQRPAEGGSELPQRVIRADALVPEPRWQRDFLAPSYRGGETGHAHVLLVLTRLFGGSGTSRLSRALVGTGQDRPLRRRRVIGATALASPPSSRLPCSLRAGAASRRSRRRSAIR